jgi:hypothetical protein
MSTRIDGDPDGHVVVMERAMQSVVLEDLAQLLGRLCRTPAGDISDWQLSGQDFVQNIAGPAADWLMVTNVISLAYVPLALLAGFAFHFAVFRSRARSRPTGGWSQKFTAVVVPVLSLTTWIVLCYGLKLLTWKPFTGDAPGTVVLTNMLLLTGSALAGSWISLRLGKSGARL